MECISVIIAVYNVEKYIDRCLRSVCAQTYPNLEIIVVDDGSTDESGMICDRIAQEDHRVHVIHKKNGGVSSARNVGLKHATGEYVSFVDGDDYLDEDMYTCMVSRIRQDKTSMAVCSFRYIYHTKTKEGVNPFVKDVISREEYLACLLRDAFAFYYSVVWNKLISRKIILENSLTFDEKWNIMEDFRFVLQLLPCIEQMSVCSNALYNYRKNNYGTATTREISFEESYSNRRHGYLWLKECVIECGLDRQYKNMLVDYLIRYLALQYAKAIYSCNRTEKVREHILISRRDFIKTELGMVPKLFLLKRKIYWNTKCLIEGMVQKIRLLVRNRLYDYEN